MPVQTRSTSALEMEAVLGLLRLRNASAEMPATTAAKTKKTVKIDTGSASNLKVEVTSFGAGARPQRASTTSKAKAAATTLVSMKSSRPHRSTANYAPGTFTGMDESPDFD